ncbi:PAAR-like domain-containing protein [Janthinobacterium sp. PC23-8]|uniref:PAAR-like domain-containing protein n=1 Tax=Janthinobacterium sp. PC23-8 TaxID=2012679 RepID=UPI000B95F9B1|nr:PAAR-like domain-containing protein [Janthinobacterium sp. PC23-8]OYO27462.1 hypothetical protein CD932_19975 [Janthinobacterium sp. PC23-8]
MFANNSLAALNMCTVPDICETPMAVVVEIPIPYPNLAASTLHIPSVFNLMFGPGLAENLLTSGTISLGDFGGLFGGLMSGVFMGPDRYLLGSMKVLAGGIFASRMTSLTGMNGMPFNTIGLTITPAQPRVLLLS